MGLFHTPALFFQLSRTAERKLLQGADALERYRVVAQAYMGSTDDEVTTEIEDRLTRGWEAVHQLESLSSRGLAVLMEALLPPALALESPRWLLAPAEAIQYRSRAAHYVLWYFALQEGGPMLLSPQDSAFAQTRALTGARDLEVGDAELDVTTIIQCQDSERLQGWLAQADVKQALRRLRAATPRWRVNHRGAGAVISAEELEPRHFDGLLRDLDNLVRRFPTA